MNDDNKALDGSSTGGERITPRMSFADEIKAKLDRIKASANERSKVIQETVPVAFLLDGTTTVSFLLDQEDSYVHTEKLHQVGSELMALCPSDGSCPLCRHLSEWDRKRAGFSQAWRYRSYVKSLLYAVIHGCTHDNTNVKTDVPLILLGPPGLETEIKGVIARLDDKEIIDFFDPEADAPLWDIRKTKSEIRITRSSKAGRCPELPDSYPPLRTFRGIDGPPSEDAVKSFKAMVDAAYQDSGGYVDPR